MTYRAVHIGTSTRRNTAGEQVRYFQLAHKTWGPTTGRTVLTVLHSLGREDTLERAALMRLVTFIQRVLGPGADTGLVATGSAGSWQLAATLTWASSPPAHSGSPRAYLSDHAEYGVLPGHGR